jgi:hypothetical protein
VRGKVAVLDELRQAIEQAEQAQPVGTVVEDGNDFGRVKALLDQDARVQLAVGTELYTHPLTAPAQPIAPEWLSYDPVTDILTIHGKRYAAGLFGEHGFLSPVGTILRVEHSQPECVTLTIVQPAPTQPPLLQDPKDKPWQRDHYPQCKTCNKSFYVGETCGWVCDGVNMYSPLEAHIKGETK